MSGILIPVAGVSAGDQFRSGTASIANEAATIAPLGFDSHRSGYGLYVFKEGETGAGVLFEFNQPYTFKPSYLNVPFTFGVGDSPLTGASVGDAARYGRATIENSAGTIAPEGFDSSVVPKVRIYYAADGSGGAIDFHFEDTYSSPVWKNTPFYFGYGLLVSGVSIGNTSSYGVPTLKAVPALNPKGIPSQAIVGKPRVGDQPNVDFNFDHSYAAPSYANTPFYFGDGLVVSGASIGASDRHGVGSVENAAHTIAPVWGNPSLRFGRAAVYFDGQNGYGVDFSFAQSYNGVSAMNTPFYFSGLISVNPAPISPPATPSPAIGNFTEYVKPFGCDAALIGHQHVQGVARHAIEPKSFVSSAYGRPSVWNYRQYLAVRGLLAQLFGTPFLSGGEKQVTPSGIAWAGAGRPTLLNTTANQNASPQGIPAPPVGSHHVSPRSVFPFGILGTSFGSAFVQFPPRPVGWLSSAFGYPVIDYKTKQVRPAGISADEAFGYPVVFDPTRHLLVSSVLQAGVFGDTAIKNTRFILKAEGFESLEFSVWASLESNRRDVTFNGFVATAFGVNSIRNKTPSLSPEGFDALQVPYGVGVGYAIRRVYTSGTDFLALGRPKLTQTPSIAPKGFTGAAGHPTVWPRVRTLEVLGHDSFKAGKLDVWFRYRIIQLEGKGIAASSYGSPRLEHQHREILAHGSSHSSMGSVKIGQRNRSIAPEGIWEDFATGHMVGGLRFLRPVGYEATHWGTRIIPEITQVYAKGFANEYGLPQIINLTSLITPESIRTTPDPVDQWGKAKVWNSIQHVTMFYDVDSELNPPAWPQWTLIENRNKVMRATGHVMTAMGRLVIANKATGIYPDGIAAPDPEPLYESGMVAYRIRRLQLEGMESPYLSTWAVVYNDAMVAAPGGVVATQYGVAALENTRREFPYITAMDQSAYGTPMIAYRVRTLEIESRYSIAPPIIRMPEAKLYTRYVEPAGDDMFRQGWASLSIHWTIITPRWTHQDFFGWSEVRNLTPELRTRGRNSEEFGDTFVRLEWRPVNPDGSSMQLFGRSTIADRDRTMAVRGWRSGAIGDKLRVIRTGAPPYSTQYIWLDGTTESGEQERDGNGIPPPGGNQQNIQVPRPTMNQKVVYVRQDSESTRYGSHRVTANSIRVEPGYWEQLVGDHLVALKIREVIAGPFSNDLVFQPSRARIDPHTIWATMDTPQQAITNHPGSPRFRPVGQNSNGTWHKGMGSPRVTLQHRSIRQGGSNNHTGYGRPNVFNTRHYIRPNGIRSYRFGWHVIPGPQDIEQFDSALTQLFGRPSVSRPPYVGPQTITGRGFAATLWGANEIQLFNRQIYPHGYLSERMGTRLANDRPYMWQGLRVGPHVPLVIGGYENERLGEPWVSFRVRGIELDGFDAFLSEYQLEMFDQRMRVRRVDPPRPFQEVEAVGLDHSAVGVPNVLPGVHFIRPDGNADQYRKGAF